KKGPSFKDKMATEPTSERLPYCPVKAAYIPPLLLVIAAMIVMVVNPIIPPIGSKNPLNKYQKATPTAYFVTVMITPFFKAFPPTRRFIWLPAQNKKPAINVKDPVLNSSSVNPPIINIS